MGISIFSKIHPRHIVTYKTPRRIGIIFHIEEFTTLKIPFQIEIQGSINNNPKINVIAAKYNLKNDLILIFHCIHISVGFDTRPE